MSAKIYMFTRTCNGSYKVAKELGHEWNTAGRTPKARHLKLVRSESPFSFIKRDIIDIAKFILAKDE